MTITRYIAVKFKEKYTGTDQKATQTREDAYKQHLHLYQSRPYVLEVEGSFSPGPASHGYHYAFVVKFESQEKIDYYADEDPDHLEFKKVGLELVQDMHIWAFPPKN